MYFSTENFVCSKQKNVKMFVITNEELKVRFKY